jgi:hypothetical protein
VPRALKAISPSAPANSPVPPVMASTEPLDRQLALIQAQSPEAFPGLPRHGAEADALVAADFVLIVGIVNLVREGEDVAGAVAASPPCRSLHRWWRVPQILFQAVPVLALEIAREWPTESNQAVSESRGCHSNRPGR